MFYFSLPVFSCLSDTLPYTHIVSLSFLCVAQGTALPLLVLIDVNGRSEEGLVRADLVISGEFHPN